ncbi:MAG: hypothetical protein AAGI50_11190 [Pseudomonadota bacterium]
MTSAGAHPVPTPFVEADLGVYLCLADTGLRLFSVFDDLTYDRADSDMLSPAMRTHAIDQLAGLGFRQKTGSILENRVEDLRCLIPKATTLGASPFDITRYTRRRPQDFYLLTPTQTACQMIDHYPTHEAVERVRALIQHQPINLLRLADYLERKPTHKAFLGAVGHLKYAQRMAISAEPLRRRRPLG